MTDWTISTESDPTLVARLAAGETQALDVLYARHGLALLGYLVGQVGDQALAEEILQDVMLAVWHGAGSFRGDSSVRTWMLAIARRRAITERQRRSVDAVALDDDLAANDTGPLDVLIQRAERDDLRAALRRLPDDQRETLELVFYHDLSGPEVAEVMGISPGTVKSRLHRAKALLKGLLGVRTDA